MQRTEHIHVSGKEITLEHRLEIQQSRVSPHTFVLQQARGKTPSLYEESEHLVINVFHKHQLLGIIRRAENGLFVCDSIAHRTVKQVVERLINRIRG